MTARRGVLVLLLAAAGTLIAGRWIAGLYADWAFYDALGANALWAKRIWYMALWRGGSFLVALTIVFANLYAVRQSVVSLVLPRRLGDLEIGEAVPSQLLTGATALLSAIIAVALALAERDWTTVALSQIGIPFEEFEPYLNRDLGFYVYALPLERALYEWLVTTVLVTFVAVLVLYALTPSLRWNRGALYISAWVRRHLGALGALIILLIAWSWRLDRFALLTEGGGALGGVLVEGAFSAVDHANILPWLTILVFVTLPAAVVFLWATWTGSLRTAFGILTALILLGPIGLRLIPWAAQAGVHERDRRAVDRAFLTTRGLFTRRAYGVDEIARPDTLALPTVELSSLASRASVWDPAALTRFLESEQRGNTVAAFAWTGGIRGLEAALLFDAPAGSPPGARWPLTQFVAGGVDPRGVPVAAGDAVDRGIGGVLVRPAASPWALVADTAGRLAAPAFSSRWQRLLIAWDLQNPRLLGVELPSPRPKVIVKRDVRDRLTALAPFFVPGPTITPVVIADSLYWVSELFVRAAHYPLSEPLEFEGELTRYLRHAATAFVQAQTGSVRLVATERPDPITRSWIRAFPELFTAREALNARLQTGTPPRTDWALVQGRALSRVGFRGDSLDRRRMAAMDDADADLAGGAPTLVQLDADGTLGWGVPVADASDEVRGMLIARGGARPRTEWHSDRSGLRWTTVLERLQAVADSAGFGRARRYSRRGRVQVIPTERGAAFVQSFYEWPPEGSPRLVGTALLVDGVTRGGARLEELVSGAPPRRATSASSDPEEFRRRVVALYDELRAAQRRGDWAGYGRAWESLGALLGRSP